MKEIAAQEVHARCQQSPATVLLDVREKDEWILGHIAGAVHLPKCTVHDAMAQLVPDSTTPIICYCAHGRRSAEAAVQLEQMGYHHVASMAGGLAAWQEAQLPIVSTSTLNAEEQQRYSRHVAIPDVGEAGQRKLCNAKVALVGAGGLGSPAALYLAAAGVGTLGLIDDDVVDLSNLQRQILHTTANVGQPKVASAAQALTALNPLITVVQHHIRVSDTNVDRLCEKYDIILDGSDNFPTRYVINDACVRAQKPFVHGSVYRFEGHVSTFWPGRGPCYRCLYPKAPPPALAPSCAEAGVLGVLPGMIGLLQATEVLKIILGTGDLLVGRLLCYDALQMTFRALAVDPDPECRCVSTTSA